MAARAAVAGFTTIELLIAVVVLGVLAAIAYPTFVDSVRKSRRAEGVSALAALQQAQERHRSNAAAYADAAASLNQGTVTASGYYAIAVTAAGASGYTATATARDGTSQSADSRCRVLAVRMDRGNLSYGAGASAVDWADPHRCWAR